ncbi:uncharacterized protein FIBRA_00940 [Fibroporia radiculosa]|uniref:Uncharacterized protein n=1 Tax=Fibroporia radiculosa TaxID=599839 RepID=J4G0P7_9APHY|nr:uncharacterized protein FIBRA_00940 [Fibroporia radiculosa]CCL98933.1 predicted protein [Fibroporia radiculosa]
MSAVDTVSNLPTDAVVRCSKEARKDGLFAGLSAGLAGAILGSKVFRFNRNTAIICGLLTGALSGYQFTQAFLSSNLARMRAELASQAKSERTASEAVQAPYTR